MSNIRTIRAQLPFWIQVTRIDRPVGWLVLMWPTWIALVLAGHQSGYFDFKIWTIFTLGVILTRSAGCVVNDLTDAKFDGHVKRTKTRPITTGSITRKDATFLAITLLLTAFGLVMLTNETTIILSCVALGLTIVYPWLKRVTFWPQVGLGVAFSMAIPMAFSAYDQPINKVVLVLFIGNVSWTLAYDTLYAMVDRDDDILIGIKSTAIAFGQFDLIAISICQAVALVAFSYAFWLSELNPLSIFGLGGALSFAIHHQIIAKTRERNACFQAFLQNHRFGAALFIGTVLGVL